MINKKCSKCLVLKPLIEMKDGAGQCKPCYNLYRKELRAYYKKHDPAYHEQERQKERGRCYVRKYWPKLSPSEALVEYNLLLSKQDSKCAMCKKDQSNIKNYLSVDHNHETGQIRGLLCQPCNSAIGFIKDNKLIMQTAVLYLEQA